MAQQLHHPASDTYYVVILLLLAYVMSSAPRYMRDLKNSNDKSTPSPTSPITEWKKALNVYTIQPYKNAWKQLTPKMEPADLLPYYSAAQ